MACYLNPTQKAALAKLDPVKWCTAASIGVYLTTLEALAKKEWAEFKFLKCSVVWRRKV